MSQRAENKLRSKAGPPLGSEVDVDQGGKPVLPDVQAQNRWLSFAVCMFLALAVWAVFGQTIHYEFVNFDDDVYVYENAAITQGLNLGGFVWAFTQGQGGNWHPLTSISHMLACQFCGLNPGGHHLINVISHAATVVLLFLVLRNLTGQFWPGAFVAAVFAVHPLRVESVAWVTERKDVLSGLFFMLTLWAYARYAQKSEVRSQKSEVSTDAPRPTPERFSFLHSLYYWLALSFLALGLMSKAMLVTVPFVLLLLDYWPLQRFQLSAFSFQLLTLRRLLLEKVPFFLLTAASCVATVWAARHSLESAQALGFPWRVGNAFVSYVAYLGQMLYPVGLAVLYPHPRNHLSVGVIALSALVLLVISVVALTNWRKRPYLLVGWLWYLGMLVPVIGLMQVGNQARADRFTYLPQIGLYIMLTWGAISLCGAWRYCRAALGVSAVIIIAALMVSAHAQTRYWRDSVSLWSHTLACTPGNQIAIINLGGALVAQGKTAKAIEHYERALRIKPDYADAHNNLGVALGAQGKWAEAINHYERALQLKPDDAEAHNNLGNALFTQGKTAEAIKHYERALQLRPDDARTHCSLGSALVSQGKLADGIRLFERAVQLQPDFAEAQNVLGSALGAQGRWKEAIEHYERALRLKPDFAEAHCNLGIELASQGKMAEAVQHFERALQLKPDFADGHFNYGIALGAQGKLAEAIEQYEQAVRLKPDYAKAHYNLGVALNAEGKVAEAIEHFERALELKPDQAEVLNDLAWALATCSDDKLRNGARAMGLAERALRQEVSDRMRANLLDTLAAAQATAGDYVAASNTARKGIEVAGRAGQTALVEGMGQRLKLYETGQPYRRASVPSQP